MDKYLLQQKKNSIEVVLKYDSTYLALNTLFPETLGPQVSNPRPRRLNYAACGLIFKLCMYNKITQQFRGFGVPLAVIFPHEARERAHNNKRGPLS